MKKTLTIILPTEAKLEEAEENGLLPRWKFYFSEYSKRYNIEIFSCDNKNYTSQINAKHYSLPFNFDFIPFGNQVLYNVYLIVSIFKMQKVLRVISASYFCLPLIKLTGKKIIINYLYDYAVTTKKDFGGLKGITAKWREFLSVKSADFVITSTSELQSLIQERYKKKSVVIPNFVDTEKFIPLKKENYIIYAGRVFWYKGLGFLIEAFKEIEKKYPEYRLKIAGKGDVEFYKNKVKCNGLKNVDFLGAVNYENMPHILGKAKVFILPTLHREGNPKALIEALSAGCACVATAVEGNYEIIEDMKNGLLVRPGNLEELMEAMVRIIEDGLLMKELSKSARKTSYKFSLENTLLKDIEMVKKYV